MSQDLFHAIFPSFVETSGIDVAFHSDMSLSDITSADEKASPEFLVSCDAENDLDMDDNDWYNNFYPIIQCLESSPTAVDDHNLSTATTNKEVDVDLCDVDDNPTSEVDVDLCTATYVSTDVAPEPKTYCLTVVEQLLLEAISVYDGYNADGSIDWDGVSWHMGHLMTPFECFTHWCTSLSNVMDGSHEVIYPIKTAHSASNISMRHFAVPPEDRVDDRVEVVLSVADTTSCDDSISKDDNSSCDNNRRDKNKKIWSQDEDDSLLFAVSNNTQLRTNGRINWKRVAKHVKSADRVQCANRWHNFLKKRHAAWN